MQTGTKWPFNDTMASMMMVSANDAAYAIAESGRRQHRRLRRRRSTRPRSATACATARSAIPPASPTRRRTKAARRSARTTSRSRRATRSTVPAIAQWADTHDVRVHRPVRPAPHARRTTTSSCPATRYGYAGADGFKTGYTEVAQHTLVATAKRDGRQCIAVILGSSDSGYTWAASLLDQCWQKPAVATTGDPAPAGRGVALRDRAAAARPASPKLAVGKRGPPTTHAGNAAPTMPATHRHEAATPTPRTSRRRDRATTASRRSNEARVLLAPSRLHLVAAAHRSSVAFFLRRRAVKRQRARRIARQRARAKAMRSGSLPVVDGRYRTGTRLGQPVESTRARRAVRHRPHRAGTGRARRPQPVRLRHRLAVRSRSYQGIETPPLGRSIWPVMNSAASDTR